jgi:hypothetical protein
VDAAFRTSFALESRSIFFRLLNAIFYSLVNTGKKPTNFPAMKLSKNQSGSSPAALGCIFYTLFIRYSQARNSIGRLCHKRYGAEARQTGMRWGYSAKGAGTGERLGDLVIGKIKDWHRIDEAGKIP